jgi:hypothetical protein
MERICRRPMFLAGIKGAKEEEEGKSAFGVPLN